MLGRKATGSLIEGHLSWPDRDQGCPLLLVLAIVMAHAWVWGIVENPCHPLSTFMGYIPLLLPTPILRGGQWWRHPSRSPGGHLPAYPGAWTADQWWPCVPGAGCGAHDCGQEAGKWLGRLQIGRGLALALPLPPSSKSVPLSELQGPLTCQMERAIMHSSRGYCVGWVRCSMGRHLAHFKAHSRCYINISIFPTSDFACPCKQGARLLVSYQTKVKNTL